MQSGNTNTPTNGMSTFQLDVLFERVRGEFDIENDDNPRSTACQVFLTPDENDALGRVVTTLERARYARPGGELSDVTDDARAVWRGALSRRRGTDRARALLLPEEGKRMWRSLGRGLLFWRRPGSDAPPED